MVHDQIFMGRWEEVSRRHASELKGRRVEIRVLDQVPPSVPARMIFEGMFPELAGVTEADFQSAEWHGPRDGDI